MNYIKKSQTRIDASCSSSASLHFVILELMAVNYICEKQEFEVHHFWNCDQ